MSNVQEWQQLANKELSRREKTVDSLVQQTAEGIAIKPLYTEADLDNLEVTGTLPGLPPYVRGPRATMYTAQPTRGGRRRQSGRRYRHRGRYESPVRPDPAG